MPIGEVLQGISTYLFFLGQAIWHALRFDPNLLEVVSQNPHSIYVTVGVPITGGASLLLGQSIILFVNRVKPTRFVAGLILNSLTYTIGLLIWAAVIWVIGTWLFAIPLHFGTIIRIMFLTTAPMVFGFFILTPYLGMAISRLLYVWSFLITLQVVAFEYQIGLGQTLFIVGLGWLLMMALTHTIGRPVLALRNFIWRRVVGVPLDTTVQDVVRKFARRERATDQPERRRRPGREP